MVKKRYYRNQSLGLPWDQIGGVLGSSIIHYWQRYKGMESLNLNKLFNWFLEWKTTFILHCGSDLLTDLYKRFLKFKENVLKNGRTTNNSLLGNVNTICLGTYNLSKNFLIHWSIIITGYLLHFKTLLRCSTFKIVLRCSTSHIYWSFY